MFLIPDELVKGMTIIVVGMTAVVILMCVVAALDPPVWLVEHYLKVVLGAFVMTNALVIIGRAIWRRKQREKKQDGQ